MSELIEVAILAYRNGRYRDAIELLLQETDTQGDCWLARLYLGMSYEKVGRIADAHRLFKRMVADCPDEHIRSKAESALPLVEAEMKRRFQKEPIKASPKVNSRALDEDVVWLNRAN